MRTIALALLALGSAAVTATAATGNQGLPLDTCDKSWGDAVVMATGVVDPVNAPASNVLGDTPNTATTIATGGCLTITFGGAFTQDGTPFSDLGVDVLGGFSDCYEIALRPVDALTVQALVNAGWEDVGSGFWKPFGLVECGDQNWDVDFYAPGNGPGTLVFDALRLCAEGTPIDPNVEFARTWANLVCPCPGPTATMVSKPCGFGPLDPVLTADPFHLFTAPTLRVETQFPNVPGWFYVSAPAAQAFNFNGCDFWLTSLGLGITSFFTTDSNGDHEELGPLLGPSFAGVEFVIQARVCAPNSQFVGPFAPYPDFFSNSLIIRIGCPSASGGNPTQA